MLRATVCVLLALVPAFACDRSSSAAEIWIQESVGAADTPSYVGVWASGVDGPIRAVQFGLDLPLEALTFPPIERDGVADRVRLDWEECWTPPAGLLQVGIGYFWCVGNCSVSASDTICIGPGVPVEIDPPAPAYQRCDGTWVPFTVVASPHGWDELPPGCAIAYSNVPLGESSWGCVKAFHGGGQ